MKRIIACVLFLVLGQSTMLMADNASNASQPKIKIRLSNQRGHFDLGWLNTFHTFSFGEYYDPKYMGYGNLRVLNDDILQPGKGFPTHAHQNMEIVSYVISGALEHKDTMGNGSIIKAGDVQYMSAGSGVKHSEFNPSKTDPVRLLQIWILPRRNNTPPKYQQISVAPSAKLNKWCCIVSEEGQRNSIGISAAVRMYATVLQPKRTLDKQLASKKAWLQVVTGQIKLDGNILRQGDGVSLDNASALSIQALQESEILLIEC